MLTPSHLRTFTALLLGTLGAGSALGLGCNVVETEPVETDASSSTSSASSGGSMVTTSTSMGGAGGATGSGGAGGATGSGGAGGATGSGGSGGSGPLCIEDTGTDACPGDTIPLTLGTNTCYEGDLATAQHDFTAAYCGGSAGSSGPDRVYHLTFSALGTLKLRFFALDGTFNPNVHVRGKIGQPATCEDATQELTCLASFPTKEAIAVELDPTKFADLFFFVDGANGLGGKYRMDVSFEAPACGDGVINASLMEACDDGNAKSGDGCDASCKLEQVTSFDACPGEPFPIALNQSLTFVSSTAPYKDGDGVRSYHPSVGGTCGPGAASSTGNDRIYQLKAKANGTVTASVGLDLAGTTPVCEQDILDPGCWDRVLYAVEAVNPDTCGATCTCDSGMTIPGDPLNGALLGNQLACSNSGTFDVETVSFPVVKDRTYFLIVDGMSTAAKKFGKFNLHVSLKP